MDEFDIERVADPDLDEPVLVEGLPGVGHVGKLAAEHLLEELESELVRRVYTTHFPPQVSIDEGQAQLACASCTLTAPTRDRTCSCISGDTGQQSWPHGLTDTFLDIADEFGIQRVFALGGVPTGELIEEYDVPVRRRPRISRRRWRSRRGLPRGRTDRRHRRRLRPTAGPEQATGRAGQ